MRLYLNGDGNGEGTHISISVDLTGNLKLSFNHQVSVSLLGKRPRCSTTLRRCRHNVSVYILVIPFCDMADIMSQCIFQSFYPFP